MSAVLTEDQPDGDPEALHGRLAVVTGAAGGIGATVAEMLAHRGVRLSLLDSDTERLAQLATRLRHRGADVSSYAVDITSSQQVETTIAAIETEQGPISLLANVAGVLRMGAVVDLTDDDWHSTFAVNASGLFYVTRAVARFMVSRSHGSIVTVSSNAGSVPRAMMAAYAASKAAATAFTHSLGLELAPYGIRCNVVAPGSTDTPMLRSMWHDEADSERSIQGDPAHFRVGIPLGRVAQPAHVADAVIFLLSNRARHITLETLTVDGGAALGA